ncbi:G-type lectin S-receptor-like serine/threonine-protein kinase At1g11330 [Durio zibethinus]|uniref:Receptor-like serine/threonine-protein kinase n=1 Tax=Durio zibethinus TaxID=66656 RepID=A0A6P5WYH1_DURZI|nr:G-type lectin S-receptor-like serine/threonine-protein kinase At1g11330 [Durio zibethinus]
MSCNANSRELKSSDMGTSISNSFLLPLLLLSSFYPQFGASLDTITSSKSIKDPEYVVSNGGNFRLGFFSPDNSTDRYVGIWYNRIPVQTVIWVANRNKPIKDSSGVLTVSEDGNLVVLNGQEEILWSSNVTNPVGNSSAQLLDSGNLILWNNASTTSMWESFQQPSDAFVPTMKLSVDERTGEKVQLTSWKSPSDPSDGNFLAGINRLNIPEAFIWNSNQPYWRSGPWNSRTFIGIPKMSSIYLNGFNLVDDRVTSYLTYAFANASYLSYFALDSQGKLMELYWDNGKGNWVVNWSNLETDCDVYGKCGAFGSCDSQKPSICSCLRGFEPKIKEEWGSKNWTSGCVRSTPLQCEKVNNGSKVGKIDGFLKLQMMKVPAFPEWSSAREDECGGQCLNNCYCVAYAYDAGIGCMLWSGNLTDIQQFSNGGIDLYIRVASSELDKTKHNSIVIIVIPVILGIIIIIISTLFFWRWMAKQRAKMQKSKETLLVHGEKAHTKFSSRFEDNFDEVKLQQLPLLKFEELATATSSFHLTKKLGQGGFGPVYRGTLQDGKEIAVKRLSRASGQGLEEFMNEVTLISKLQHRNLVRLLGCCVEGEEKMLVYEYMPNKSLDAFLFDPVQKGILNWRKRFNIIEGISRGLLYLHRDSRLKIIHRDLKASNILLDKELNPKISDFGMARIFGGDKNQAKTTRVVGTYGYMSPEYAMQGRFSEKSDVFSYGVLLLEIVSGRKNAGFYDDEHSISLLGYVWKLWNEDNILALIDPVLSDPCNQSEILRCIHVGLLCVQEFAEDRPTVSTVISMLNSEIADLPTPKQPAFTGRPIASGTISPQSDPNQCSINKVTITIVDGR